MVIYDTLIGEITIERKEKEEMYKRDWINAQKVHIFTFVRALIEMWQHETRFVCLLCTQTKIDRETETVSSDVNWKIMLHLLLKAFISTILIGLIAVHAHDNGKLDFLYSEAQIWQK